MCKRLLIYFFIITSMLFIIGCERNDQTHNKFMQYKLEQLLLDQLVTKIDQNKEPILDELFFEKLYDFIRENSGDDTYNLMLIKKPTDEVISITKKTNIPLSKVRKIILSCSNRESYTLYDNE